LKNYLATFNSQQLATLNALKAASVCHQPPTGQLSLAIPL